MSTHELIVTVGLPRSGKSTWAKQQGLPIVNRDSVRLALHGERFLGQAEPMVDVITHLMVEALFLAGHRRVIADETCTTRKRRDAWRSDKRATTFYYVATSEATCIDRAVGDGRSELVPIIERMAQQFEPLDDDEALWGSNP